VPDRYPASLEVGKISMRSHVTQALEHRRPTWLLTINHKKFIRVLRELRFFRIHFRQPMGLFSTAASTSVDSKLGIALP
jgi:hypothetical protein